MGGRVHEAYDSTFYSGSRLRSVRRRYPTVFGGYEAYDGAFYSLVQNRQTPTGRMANDSAVRPNSNGGGAGTVAATTAPRLSRTAVEWTNGVGHGEFPVDGGEAKF